MSFDRKHRMKPCSHQLWLRFRSHHQQRFYAWFCAAQADINPVESKYNHAIGAPVRLAQAAESVAYG